MKIYETFYNGFNNYLNKTSSSIKGVVRAFFEENNVAEKSGIAKLFGDTGILVMLCFLMLIQLDVKERI